MSNERSPAISLSVENGVAVMSMNRPRQRNPFTEEFIADFRRCLDAIEADAQVGAVVLIGADGVFSAGGDVKGMVERIEQGGASAADIRRRMYGLHEWIQRFRTLERPVIAAVDGPAFGGGLGLALMADFVLCTPRAQFCAVFARIGLVPDVGLFYTLPRMVGLQRAKELMATARVVDADEARALGLVMEIHPAEALRSAALEMAGRLCEANPVAFAITKRLTNQSFDMDVNALIEAEAAAQGICMATGYHADAVRRFRDKQPLRFVWPQPPRT